jgi:hypothetical protein
VVASPENSHVGTIRLEQFASIFDHLSSQITFALESRDKTVRGESPVIQRDGIENITVDNDLGPDSLRRVHIL